MNLVIRNIEADIKLGDTLLQDAFPNLKADFVMAHPPFNLKNWGGETIRDDRSAEAVLGDDILRKIAAKLLDKIKRNTGIDWQKRESVQARLRNLVRITLRRYHYPPDKQEQAIDLVLEQAERLSDVFSDPDLDGQ